MFFSVVKDRSVPSGGAVAGFQAALEDSKGYAKVGHLWAVLPQHSMGL